MFFYCMVLPIILCSQTSLSLQWIKTISDTIYKYDNSLNKRLNLFILILTIKFNRFKSLSFCIVPSLLAFPFFYQILVYCMLWYSQVNFYVDVPIYRYHKSPNFQISYNYILYLYYNIEKVILLYFPFKIYD